MIPSGYLEISQAGKRGEGLHARLELIEGVFCLTRLGGGEIQSNGVALKTNIPYFIQPGEIIRLGALSLTWQTAENPAPSIVEPAPPPGLGPPRFILEVTHGEERRAIPLEGETISLGRADENDIVIKAEGVSRRHARLERELDGYRIRDLGSKNGIRLENRLVSDKLLADGDVLWIAQGVSLVYRFQAGDDDIEPSARQQEPPTGLQERTLVVPKGDTPGARTPRAASPGLTGQDRTVIPARPSAVGPGTGGGAAATLLAPRGKGGETVTPAPKLLKPREAGRPVKAPAAVFSIEGNASIQTGEQPAVTVLVKRRGDPVASSRPALFPGYDLIGTMRLAPQAVEALTPATTAQLLAVADKPVASPGRIEVAAPPGATGEQPSPPASLTLSEAQIPHLVVHLPASTWEAPLIKERVAIGRTEDNDLVIAHSSISRRHAVIEQHGCGFVIRDAGSTNGVWLGDQKVAEHWLEDGDTLRIGRARLVFKAGFSLDDLTLAGAPRGQNPRRPVVVIPGIMGSELWLGSEKLWPNPVHLLSHPELARYPGDPRVEARALVNEVVLVPGFIKLEQYGRLGDYLETGLDYTRGLDLLEFPYDWRQDVRLSARQLGKAIEHWQPSQPVTIIAHSLGSLVSRYYVEALGGKQRVERLVLLGGPHYGSPKALDSILNGPGLLPFGLGAGRLRNLIATFPSMYQLLPSYAAVFDQDGRRVNLLGDDRWLPEEQRPFLKYARSFRRELGSGSSIPAVSIFGYGQKTVTQVKVQRGVDGGWARAEFSEELGGDLTVPAASAVLQHSEIHPVPRAHGSLYVDNDVKMRLKMELTRATTWQRS